MDFELSPEQKLLQETARSFVDRYIPPRRAKEWDESHHPPTDLLRKMGDLGWFAVSFSEADGGLGGTALDTAGVAQQLGRARLDVAMVFLGGLIPGRALAMWGAAEQRQRHPPPLITGAGRLATP